MKPHFFACDSPRFEEGPDNQRIDCQLALIFQGKWGLQPQDNHFSVGFSTSGVGFHKKVAGSAMMIAIAATDIDPN